MMEKVPSDIMLEILSRLPQETMISCKLVCKPWRDILVDIKIGLLFQFGDPGSKICCYGGEKYDDIDLRGHYSYTTLVEIDKHRSFELEPPLSEMVGSCNGLVCFSVRRKYTIAYDPIYICNPITEEYIYLPTFNYEEPCNDIKAGCFNCGFGYHNSMDEYKVVRIHHNPFDPNNRCGQAQVYTLGSGHGWRDIGRIDHRLNAYPGVCANGALHWIECMNYNIVAFDLADEKFRLIPPPLLLPPISPSVYNGLHTISLKLLRGYLCFIHIDIGKGIEKSEDFINIWALEKKYKFSSYDMKEHEFNDFWRWSKKFSIPSPKDATYMPFAVTKSNQVLMSYKRSILCYDSETTIIKKLWEVDTGRSIQAIPHVNSLVSLEALGEKSKRRS